MSVNILWLPGQGPSLHSGQAPFVALRTSSLRVPDQGELFLPAPALDLTLPSGGCMLVRKILRVQEVGTVLSHPTSQVGRNPRVQHTSFVADVNVPHDAWPTTREPARLTAPRAAPVIYSWLPGQGPSLHSGQAPFVALRTSSLRFAQGKLTAAGGITSRSLLKHERPRNMGARELFCWCSDGSPGRARTCSLAVNSRSLHH